MKEPVLAVDHLSLVLDGATILKDVSFTVGGSEWFAIIGPNGAGKTSLLKCLLRIHRATGSIRLDGRPLERFSQRELARCVSHVPQQTESAIPFRVEEYVMMGRYPHLSLFSTFGFEDRQAVQEAMVLTETIHLADRPMSTLSGGERQAVAIAAALAQGARIMLLDEPAAFLDPAHTRNVHRLIGKINREQGTSIIMITHDINSAAIHADRIGIMKSGRFVYQGLPADIMSNDILAPVYGMDFYFHHHAETGIPIILPEVSR